jgi:anti-sigma factor RsiW
MTTPLTCEQMLERFDRYREGDLQPDELRDVEAHFRGCLACREGYQRFLEAVSVLHHLPSVSAPADFVDQLQGQIHRRSRGRFFSRRIDWSSRLPYEVLSVVMLIAIIAIFLFIFLGRGGGALSR